MKKIFRERLQKFELIRKLTFHSKIVSYNISVTLIIFRNRENYCKHMNKMSCYEEGRYFYSNPKVSQRVILTVNEWSLDFVKGNDVHRLNIILKSNNLILEIIHHNLVIFNDTSNLEFLDTVTENKCYRSFIH